MIHLPFRPSFPTLSLSWTRALGWLALVGLLWQCDLVNPEEATPAYLKIEEFTFTTSVAQGSNHQKITEVWVSINGEFLGVYDLPALVPVLAFGPTVVKLEAGIRDNGISSIPEIYPFYDPFTVNVDLAAGQTTNITPSTRYIDGIQFGFIEDFEDSRPRIFVEQLTGETPLNRTQTDVFEGGYSGHIALTKANNPVVELATGLDFGDLQSAGVFVYLEVTYKSEAPVAWGIVGPGDAILGPEGFFDVGFTPKDDWNKIYFNLSEMIFTSQLDEYKIGLQAFLLETSPDSANVFLDNIKLVHF